MKKRAALLLTALLLFMPLCVQHAEEQTTPDQWLQNWYDVGNHLRTLGNYPYVEVRRAGSLP